MGMCSAVMVSDSLLACSLPTHMPTLGNVPHGHHCAWITGLEELGGGPECKRKNRKKAHKEPPEFHCLLCILDNAEMQTRVISPGDYNV